MRQGQFFADRGLERDAFYLMTCHRRESVESPEPLSAILEVIWPEPLADLLSRQLPDPEPAEGVRPDRLPSNVTMVDPIGYRELLALLGRSRGALTDSGTVVEETAVIGVPVTTDPQGDRAAPGV